MAVDIISSKRPAGRPIVAAIISTVDDDEIELYDNFFRICKQLTFSDRLAISYGLGITFRTVDNWYYGYNFPKEKSIAKGIINWYENGKPVKKIDQCDSLQNLL